MIKRLLMVVSITLLLCTQVRANNGDMLFDCLDSDDQLMQLAGEAYVTGAYQMAIVVGMVCPVDGVTHEDMISIVYGFLKDNPKVRHYGAPALVGAVLERYFPCNKDRKEVRKNNKGGY